MKVQARASLVVSVLALVVAVSGVAGAAAGALIGSKQIRNGSVKSVDLRNNGVASADLKNNGVQSSDLAPESVEGEALALPEPVQCHVEGSATLKPPTADYTKVATLCSYDKVEPESVLEINWTGSVEGRNEGEGGACVFQLRVNGAAIAGGGGEAFARGLQPANVSAIFTGLAPGHLEIEVWARGTLPEDSTGEATGDRCVVGPANAGVSQTLDVVEAVV